MNHFNRLSATIFALILASPIWAATDGPSSEQLWRRIDFDADLTTYLVNLKQVSRKGDIASVWELDVPGRTSLSTGGQAHALVERLFNCKDGTQRLGEVLQYRDLSGKAESLKHEDISFKVQAGSLDETEMKLACNNEPPPANVEYPSIAEAVAHAFGDAVKLPREQSNKTLKGMGGPMGMGPPPNAAAPGNPAGPAPR